MMGLRVLPRATVRLLSSLLLQRLGSMRFATLVFGFVLLLGTPASAELTRRDRAIVSSVNATISKAGMFYKQGKFKESGEQITKAMNQIQAATKAGSPELHESLQPAFQRLTKAHTLLEFEGVSLPPFRKPKPPEAMSKSEPKTGTDPADGMVSFTKQIAPILVSRCGRCHVTDSKGRFNMANYEILMKGPPEGVVVFAGDVRGSRLIETIETGDMPRGGGKVPAAELALLKSWIKEGAKFDGQDPTMPLAGNGQPAPMPNNPRLQVRRATGKETVSFASDVAPLLLENCNGCHIDAMQTRGGLRMDTFAQLLRGGDSGAIVVPGKGEESLLIKKLRGTGEGNRMPAGRPPLSDDSIALISKWIDEGATLDGASDSQPLRVMSQLAWAAKATPEQMSEKRRELAERNLKLVAADAKFEPQQTEHFLVTGTVSSGTLALVAEQAEAQMRLAESVVTADGGEAYFHGRATIFVMPRRYDYNEFAKMVEGRGVPSGWSSHWKYDGIDAYVVAYVTERDEEEVVEGRLAAPIVSLAVASRSGTVPRWLAEGVGVSVASRKQSRDREELARREAEMSEAFAAMENAKKFLDGKMTPEQTDRIGAAIATALLDRRYRPAFNAFLRNLGSGTPYEQAFTQAFRAPPEAFVKGWLKFARGG